MALGLKANEPVDKGIKRIVCRELDEASDRLANPGDISRAVHDTRVHFKKIRAVLKMARGELGNNIYHLENYYFRDAARPLTKVRDAQAQVETLDKLADHFSSQIERDVISPIREKLRTHYDEVRKDIVDEQDTLNSVMEIVKEARNRPALWSIGQNGWQALESGVKRVYKNGYGALEKATRQPTSENLHEWRKQAKYLWYQMEALEKIRPDKLKKFNKRCHKLTTFLGDYHDLHVLKKTLSSNPAAYQQDNGVDIMGLIDRRQEELKIEAFELGRLVYAEKPRAFTKRLSKYWHGWSQ